MMGDLALNITASAIWATLGALVLYAAHLIQTLRRHRRAGRFWGCFLDDTIIVLGTQATELTEEIEASGLSGSGEIVALTYLTRRLEQIGASQVGIKLARDLEQDDWTRNMILVGGNDTNSASVAIARQVAPQIEMSTDWRDLTLTDSRRDMPRDRLSIVKPSDHHSNSVLVDYGMIIFSRNPNALRRHVLIVSGGTGFGCQHAAWRSTSDAFLQQALVRQGRPMAETYKLDVVNKKPHLARDILMSSLPEV
jgi:hypothetical protein